MDQTESCFRGQSLSIVIPAYNERGNIEKTVESALRVMRKAAMDFEIVIVDDASTDGTDEIVFQLAEWNPEIKLVLLPQNRKLGGAIKAGLEECRNQLIFYTDADNPIDFSEMVAALPLVWNRKADIVIGYRTTKAESPIRWIYSKGYNFIINRLFGLGIRDVNFAFKLFRRDVIEALEIRSNGSFIDAEFLIEAKKAGMIVREIPARFRPRSIGRSSQASPRIILGLLKELTIYWWTRRA